MARWFADLASPDAGVREAAKVSLMAMGRDDVPGLRKLVEERKPLLPSQAAVLKEIVTQMYLAGDAYETAGREGFLGIRPAEVTVGVHPPDPQQEAPNVAPVPQQHAQVAPVPFGNGWDLPDPNSVYGIVVMERHARLHRRPLAPGRRRDPGNRGAAQRQAHQRPRIQPGRAQPWARAPRPTLKSCARAR